MPKTRDLTAAERSTICALHKEGVSLTDLAKRYNVARSTVARINSKFKETGIFSNLPRSGRGRSTTARQDRSLYMLKRAQPTASSQAITRQFNMEHNTNISASTTRSRMMSFRLRSRVAKKTPIISACNKKKRLTWARKHSTWTVDQWRNVVFTGEVPIRLVQTKQRQYVGCYKKEVFQPGMTKTMIHGGGSKIMYWGCFRGDNIGQLVEIPNHLDSAGYIQLLQDSLNVDDLVQFNYILQQDNVPIHKSQVVMDWFQQQGLTVMPWPPQSPDANPIEQVWATLKEKLEKMKITSKAMLRLKVQDVWREITPNCLNELIESMPAKMAAIIANRGGFTHY